MNLVQESDLESLLEERSGPCISVYFPTSGSGSQVQQIRSRLKRLLDRTRTDLRRRGLGPGETETLLGPLEDLLASLSFWNRRNAGIAVFRAPGFIRAFHVPHGVPELCTVGDHFFLAPLTSERATMSAA